MDDLSIINNQTIHNNNMNHSNQSNNTDNEFISVELAVDLEDIPKDISNIIKIKDGVLSNMKDMNIQLVNLLVNMNNKIDKSNDDINKCMNNYTTIQNTNLLMNIIKKQEMEIYQETKNNKELTTQVDEYKKNMNIFKKSYNQLNKLYISRLGDNLKEYMEYTKITNDLKNNIKELENVKEELNKLKEMMKCKICYSTKIDTILEPCCHLCLCHNCCRNYITNRLSNNTEPKCPMCNNKITAYRKLFLPF